MWDNDTDSPVGEEPRQRSYFPFTWVTLLAVGWTLYELTAQPALGVMAVCLKFGWEDFRSALWLRRTDPERRRGRAYFWLYGGWGLWKTAAVALVMGVAYAVLVSKQAGPAVPNNALEAALQGTFLTCLGGFCLATLATVYAFWLGWRGRLKLWLSGDVHRARRAKCWPPSRLVGPAENYLGCLMMLGIILGSLVLVLTSTIVVGVVLSQFMKDGRTAVLVIGLMMGLIIGIPAALLALSDRLRQRVGANLPSECWPDAEEEDERNPAGGERRGRLEPMT